MATNFGKLNFSTSFNPTSAFPLDARCYFESLEKATQAAAKAEEAGSSNTVYHYGQTFVVVEGGKSKLYIVQPDKTLKEAGSGALTATNYTEAKSLAQADNKGTIIYVENDETIKEETFKKGPYIVTGVGTILKLGTTTASGDLSGDVGTLKTEVNELKTTVGNAESGLVKDINDLKIADETINTELAKKYVKPETGITNADLAEEVNNNLTLASTAIQSLTIAGKTLSKTEGTLTVEEIKTALNLKDAAYVTVESLNQTAQEKATQALEDAKSFTTAEISKLMKAQMVVVETKPQDSEAKEGVIYLVGTKSPYAMWIYESKEWISLGTTEVDLSNYYTKEEANGKFAIKTEVTAELANKLNIETFNTEKATLEGKIAEAKAVADGHTPRITALEGTVGNAEEGLVKDVADLKTGLGNTEKGLIKDVTDLKASVATKAEKAAVDTLTGRVGANEKSINALQEADKLLATKEELAAVSTKADKNEATIAALNTTVTDSKTGLVKKIADLTTAVSNKAETSVVNELQTTVEGHTSQITALEGKIPTTEAINSQIKAITDPLNKKVTTLEGFKSTTESKLTNLEEHSILDTDTITINGGSASTVF